MVPFSRKVGTSFHGVDNLGFACLRQFDDDFDFIGREVVAHELVPDLWTVVVFFGSAGRMAYCMKDVVTGQAVLERGSANSDVLEEYHASMCAKGGVYCSGRLTGVSRR